MGTSQYGIIIRGKTWEACMKIYNHIDEWYYIVVSNIITHPEESWLHSHFTLSNPRIFKCDQWEGLLKCIKKEFIDENS